MILDELHDVPLFHVSGRPFLHKGKKSAAPAAAPPPIAPIARQPLDAATDAAADEILRQKKKKGQASTVQSNLLSQYAQAGGQAGSKVLGE